MSSHRANSKSYVSSESFERSRLYRSLLLSDRSSMLSCSQLSRNALELTTPCRSSFTPVLSSFVILVLVTCIYAVLAVNLFQDRNPALFGDFKRALFTMFTVRHLSPACLHGRELVHLRLDFPSSRVEPSVTSTCSCDVTMSDLVLKFRSRVS